MRRIPALIVPLLLAVVIASLSSTLLAHDSSPITSDPASPVISAVQSSQPVSDTNLTGLSPEGLQKLRSYSRLNVIWLFVSFGVGVGVLLLILFTGWSAKFRSWAQVARKSFFITWLYIAILAVAVYVLQFPFTLFRGFFVEKHYGFLNQGFFGWFGEDILSLVIMIILAIVPVWLFYAIVRHFKRWWLIFTASMVPVIIFFIVFAPVVIQPIFNEYKPLKNEKLKNELLALASKAGIKGSHIYEVDASKQSSRVNAYVTGLFGSKRIVLYDTLIKNFTPNEIRFVMAHEMGHYVRHDVWLGTLIAVTFLLFVMWLISLFIPWTIRKFHARFGCDHLGDVASLPLVLLLASVLYFVLQPFPNMASRAMEHRADSFAMKISGVSDQVAAEAFRKLGRYNLSNPNPSPFMEFWFYTHPSLKQRIDFVLNYHRQSASPAESKEVEQ
jgi:STE24 endopeptidase